MQMFRSEQVSSIPTYEGFLKHVDKYFETKVIAKVKMEKTKQIKREIKEQSISELRRLKRLIIALTNFQKELIECSKRLSLILSTE